MADDPITEPGKDDSQPVSEPTTSPTSVSLPESNQISTEA
jgi:hypothetical protein